MHCFCVVSVAQSLVLYVVIRVYCCLFFCWFFFSNDIFSLLSTTLNIPLVSFASVFFFINYYCSSMLSLNENKKEAETLTYSLKTCIARFRLIQLFYER